MAFALLAALLAPRGEEPAVVTSPDGAVVVTFDLKEVGGAAGGPVCRVQYRGRPVLDESRLSAGEQTGGQA